MEDLVIRYSHNGNTRFIDNDGNVINDWFVDDKDIRIFQDSTNKAIINDFCVKTYSDLLDKFKKDKNTKTPKLYENFIIGDYLVVLRKEMKFKETIFVSYKFENDRIKQLMKLLFDNRDFSQVVASYRTQFNWIGTPEALEVLFAAAMLDNDGIVKFAQHKKLKKNGKVRIYYAPDEKIKEPLQKVNLILQRAYDKKNADFQVAYKKGKSVYNNAEIHRDKKYVFNIDLKDFYPSCKRELVWKYVEFLFRGAPSKEKAINAFLDVILIDDGLFIGNPISGCLANTILNKAVLYIKNMCLRKDMKFSVYADDMSFSSDKFISEKYVKQLFSEAFTTYGLESYFKLNDEKSIGYSGCNRKVTGISINQNNDITVSRKYYRTLRTMIAHLANGDSSVNIKKLQGKIAYATMIDDSGKIYRYLLKFKDTVEKYSLCSKEKMKKLEKKFKGRV